MPKIPPPERIPSRHRGSRLVTRTPDLVRALVGMRDDIQATRRPRREEMGFAPADWTRGEPATSAVMANVHVTLVYRSGHAVFVDLLAGTGTSSVLAAQLVQPDLGLTGSAATTTPAGGERQLRLQLDMPATWQVGEARLVYVQAQRVSGADATTLRVLRAWQR
jgi:hypothetical protein